VSATGDGVIRLYCHTKASSQSLSPLANPRLPLYPFDHSGPSDTKQPAQ
jgi:hypothetical protein